MYARDRAVPTHMCIRSLLELFGQMNRKIKNVPIRMMGLYESEGEGGSGSGSY